MAIGPSITFGFVEILQFHTAALIALVAAGSESTDPLIHELPPLLQGPLEVALALFAAHGAGVSIQSVCPISLVWGMCL